jgi:hypothetical protein
MISVDLNAGLGHLDFSQEGVTTGFGLKVEEEPDF